MFRPIPASVDLASLEEAELARWKQHDIFTTSVARRAGAPQWTFYEGPPSANGKPGLHHVWARSYKDLLCRFQTMRGHYVPRRAGWDTHGLPVEVAVEKALGISGKRQIEETVGIAEFTRLCRESVLAHVDEWRAVTERIGYWVDLDAAYWTFDPTYIDSVWWQLKQLFDRGLLYEDLKVVPYCPRCGTALSSHELGQPEVYTDETEETAYAILPLIDGDPAVLGSATSLVVWTTTPWTLLSNVGVAINPTFTYAVVDHMVVAESLVDSVFGEGAVITGRISGADLVGLHYERPFSDVPLPDGVDACRVVAADYVTLDEGTGLVHLSPAFGEIDRVVSRANGLPTLNPVGPDGRFDEQIDWLEGKAVREANTEINDRLAAASKLLRRMDYTHALPHCWRCKTTLIYWGKPSWYIATSQFKETFLAENAEIDWHPATIRDGRFGDWLANNVDWALSRDRYWGTPLPIWRCEVGHVTAIGSRAELSALCGRDVSSIDPHRPTIDEVTFDCPACIEAGAPTTATRLEPVIDVWFDSGAMPAAQVGYPHVEGSEAAFAFPADYISEAIDQTRGWFYSLLAVNTLVFGAAPYRHVMCLGHIVDADGKKMSKSVGNVIDPWEILSTRGADALRWWMFSQGSPWAASRVSFEVIDNAMRQTLLTLWNTFSFFTTYASTNGFDPADPAIPPVGERTVLDRWILSRLASTVEAVTNGLEGYEPLGAATALASLVDDLSNWYVRRSRRRFWRTDEHASPTDALGAQATLHEVLLTISLILAPFCPFMADVLYRELAGRDDADSVHFADWPAVDAARIDAPLCEQMDLARRLTSLGRAARSEGGIKVRQPLARALVYLAPGSAAIFEDIVADELNVDVIETITDLAGVLHFDVVPNFKLVGPRLGEAVKHLRPALAALDGAAVAAALEAGNSIDVNVDGTVFAFGAEELELRVRSEEGFAVSRVGGEVVALDLELNADLIERGALRELIRQTQDLRKASGFDVGDRITVWLSGADALSGRFEELSAEVLATSVVTEAGPGEPTELSLEGIGPVSLWVARV